MPLRRRMTTSLRAIPGRTLRVSTTLGNRTRQWLAGGSGGLLTLALLIGVGAGIGAVVFRGLILWFTRLFTGHLDYSAAGHAGHPAVPWLGMWFILFVPVVGGLLYGPLVDRFAKEARGHGVPEVMYAVSEEGGRIRPQVAVVKSLASALCIGSGGSVGREGPIVQIGSALGSSLGQFVDLSESKLRVLVACGAAGGISATFNAPIAGVFFGLELILRDFETEAFGVVVVSSVVADVIGRAVFGSHPFLALPAFQLGSVVDLGFYALLGILAAVIGVTFIRVLYGLEDVLDRVWKAPEWLRPGVGGILLGLLLLAIPQMYGVGYPVLERAIRGQYVLWFLLVLLFAKVLATSLTIGIGGSGGVFAPSLFMGAMLGEAFGVVLNHLAPGVAGPAGAYGLVGMGAVFAGAARAPITAVLIIFELTGEYHIILPLMLAVVLATAISKLLSGDSIYTLKLRRRGVDITRKRNAGVMASIRVRQAMGPVPAPLSETADLDEVVARLSSDGVQGLPVLDASGTFVGTVTQQDTERAARDGVLTTAAQLAVRTPVLRDDQTLEDAVGVLVHHDGSGLPVMKADDHEVVGWLSHRDVLAAYRRQADGTQV